MENNNDSDKDLYCPMCDDLLWHVEGITICAQCGWTPDDETKKEE